MDLVLSSLPDRLLRFIEDQLANDESSSDDELSAHFILTGLSRDQAERAMRYRDLYRLHIYLEGYTPIRAGSQAIRFNPHRRQFESAATCS